MSNRIGWGEKGTRHPRPIFVGDSPGKKIASMSPVRGFLYPLYGDCHNRLWSLWKGGVGDTFFLCFFFGGSGSGTTRTNTLSTSCAWVPCSQGGLKTQLAGHKILQEQWAYPSIVGRNHGILHYPADLRLNESIDATNPSFSENSAAHVASQVIDFQTHPSVFQNVKLYIYNYIHYIYHHMHNN